MELHNRVVEEGDFEGKGRSGVWMKMEDDWPGLRDVAGRRKITEKFRKLLGPGGRLNRAAPVVFTPSEDRRLQLLMDGHTAGPTPWADWAHNFPGKCNEDLRARARVIEPSLQPTSPTLSDPACSIDNAFSPVMM